MNIKNQIQNLLQSKSEVEFWSVAESLTQRKEFYLVQGDSGVEANQSRLIEINDCFLTVWIPVGGSGADAKLGSAHGRIDASGDLTKQVGDLIEKAKLGSQRAWKPVGPKAGAVLKPEAKLCAHQFLENFSQASDVLMKTLISDIEGEKEGKFNSSELFCSLTSVSSLNSLGVALDYQRSSIYVEVCFSEAFGGDSQELMEVAWSARPEDLDFKAMCRKSVEGAKGLLKAKTTPAGTYQAKLHAQDLGLILSNLKPHFSGEHRYSKLPFFEKGAELIPSFAGHAFELKLNPDRDFGLNSLGYDVWGMREQELLLASGNRVESGYYSQKMAQYLDEKPNVSQGVLEILPTAATSGAAPKEYLEIVQFSGLFVESMSMTFSSEIRLGILHKADGTREYVKGGNFSGSFKENFARVQWSDQKVLVGVEGEQSVLVPASAFLNDVSVS